MESVSTNTRAEASNWSGMRHTATVPTMVATQAAASAGQRNFHMRRAMVRTCWMTSSIRDQQPF
jgi:hypothetical protein